MYYHNVESSSHKATSTTHYATTTIIWSIYNLQMESLLELMNTYSWSNWGQCEGLSLIQILTLCAKKKKTVSVTLWDAFILGDITRKKEKENRKNPWSSKAWRFGYHAEIIPTMFLCNALCIYRSDLASIPYSNYCLNFFDSISNDLISASPKPYFLGH